MQSSNIVPIFLTLAVFALTAALFFALGRGLAEPEMRVSEPLVVIPLDEEAEALRAELARVTIDRDRLQDRLSAAIERLALSEEELREAARQVDDISKRQKAAQGFYAAELARSSALQAELATMARHVEERDLEIEVRGATIAALEKALDETLAAEEAVVEAAVATNAPAEPLNNTEVKLPAPDTSEEQTAQDPIASELETGLLAYKDHDYEAAFKAWLPLAEQGVRRAQFYLGGLYLDGRGIAADKIQAIYWLTLADEAGYAPSAELLAEVTAHLDATERAAAKKLLDARTSVSP